MGGAHRKAQGAMQQVGKSVTLGTTVEEIQAALRSYGADVALAIDSDEIVFDALDAHWKKRKQPPTAAQLAEVTKLSKGMIFGALERLLERGRVLRPRTGFWIPKK